MRVLLLCLCLFVVPVAAKSHYMTEPHRYVGSGGHSPAALTFCKTHLAQIHDMGVEAAREDFERWVANEAAPDEGYVAMVRQMLDLFDAADPGPAAMACLNFMKGQRT